MTFPNFDSYFEPSDDSTAHHPAACRCEHCDPDAVRDRAIDEELERRDG